NGPNPPYGQGQPSQGQPTPPTEPQDPYRDQAASSQPPAPQQGYGSYAQQAPQSQPQPAYGTGYGGYEGAAPQYSSQKKSSVLGIVALVLAVLAAILYIVFSVLSGQATVELAQMSGGSIPEDTTNVNQAATETAMAAAGFMVAQVVPAILGLAGLICGIVSAATARGRAWGVVAIILAVASPIIAFIVYGSIVAPVAQ